MGDAAASGKQKADASSTPHDSPYKLRKRGSKKTKRSDASLQSSRSEDDEESVTGAVETGKSKLARRTGLQSVQVKSFEIHFLENSSYACPLIRGFSQHEGSSSKADRSPKGVSQSKAAQVKI